MYLTKKGFTIFEMMIVLALIGLFFAMTSSMTRDVRIYQTNAERLANSIYDTIRTARNNMIIGRGVQSGSTMVVTNMRTISITHTGVITTYTYNTNNTRTESQIIAPFFDNDKQYTITDIAVSSGGMLAGVVPIWDLTGSVIESVAININPNADMTITGSTLNSAIIPLIRTLKITAGYNGFEHSVIIDRVTGTVELKRSNED